AYRNHPLYVLERWLGAYQWLRPRGPVLGVCSGEAVFPRACVQQLRSRHQWLKEGRRVRDGEAPVKTLTRKPPAPRAIHRRNPYQSRTHILPHECFPSHVAARMRSTARAAAAGRMGSGSTAAEDEDAAAAAIGSMDGRGGAAAARIETEAGAGRATGDDNASSPSTITIELFGEWQTDTWRPPPAVDGRIPKNERGQVEVWSEKCLPPGTVHLRLPRLVTVVQRLGFDFAPAVVGFEWKGGKATPKYEGLVVCAEHADTIVDAYTAEEQRHLELALQRRRNAALERWHALIGAMLTRQRLQDTYEAAAAAAAAADDDAAAGGGGGAGGAAGDDGGDGVAAAVGVGVMDEDSFEGNVWYHVLPYLV
ncbi:unnamed protein product, partial [Closterium sp. Yama58-4]